MGRISSVEAVKRNKKVLYRFEIFAVVFELKNKTSKPMCGHRAASREFVARSTSHSMKTVMTRREEMYRCPA